MIYFTADEHYGHTKIIKYCNRPFSSVEEMDEFIITAHNDVVRAGDLVVHVGDFALSKDVGKYMSRLNGERFFIRGSHDRWMGNMQVPYIWERKIGGQWVVCCHYAMRTWPRSHYGSWQLFGHSHGKLKDHGTRQMDVGVDTNDFRPYSFDDIATKLGG